MEPGDQGFGGRVGIVTGGSGGIGGAVALRLKKLGAIVHTVDISGDITSTSHRVDVRSVEGCRHIVDRIANRDGTIGLLVNAAAQLGEIGPVESLDRGRWRDTFAVNVEGALNMMAAVLPGMYEQQFGRIVNIASMAGEYGAPNKAAYVATKHAVLGLTKTVALEAGARGVTCNAVSPTWVDTDMARRQFESMAQNTGANTSEEIAVRIARATAVGRLVQADEVAALIVDILKHSSVTGTRIAIDGGVGAGAFNILHPVSGEDS